MAERLSALDAAWLGLRWPEHPPITFRVLVFDGPPPGLDGLREHVSRRLPLVPRLRQRVKGGGRGLVRPRWVEDRGFDLHRHVRAEAVPPPGDEAALSSLAAELSARPMDLRLPLWELLYVEGIEAGRFAVAARFHHSLADGLSALRIVELLFPHDDDGAPASASRGVQPGPAASPGARVGPVRTAVRRARRLRRVVARNVTDVPHAVRLLRTRGDAPPTPLNRGPSGRRRSVEWILLPLADVRRTKAALGTTINNLVLAALTGALRRYLGRRGVEGDDPIAMVPVSSRPQDALDRLGNQLGAAYPRMPVSEADPDRRLRAVMEEASRSAASLSVPGSTLLTTVARVGPMPVMRRVMRRSLGADFYNVGVTNMIGPTSVLHCCGRPLRELLPVAITTPFHGVTIGVVSYLDTLAIALTTDRDRVPDGHLLAADLRASLDELRALAAASTGSEPAA